MDMSIGFCHVHLYAGIFELNLVANTQTMEAPAAHAGLLLSLFCHPTAPDNLPCVVTTMSEETAADKGLIHDSVKLGQVMCLFFPVSLPRNARESPPRLNNKGSGVLSTSS